MTTKSLASMVIRAENGTIPSLEAQVSDLPDAVAELLTVIITTSPTPSVPSTDLLSGIFDKFRSHCPSLFRCRVIVTFDTYERINNQDRLKRGLVTPLLADNYVSYKALAKDLVLREFGRGGLSDTKLIPSREKAEFGAAWVIDNSVPLAITRTEDGRVTFIEPELRIGFSLAVREGLRLTTTPYVWIQQHDWALAFDIPIAPLLEIMQGNHDSETAPIRYVCLSSGRMRAHEHLDHVIRFPMLRQLVAEHRGDFSPPSQPELKIPLTPLFFWHDKPHIASTAHYLARVYPPRAAVMRGSFIEDTIGHRARTQMKEGLWAKWACWLYYPDQGATACLTHLKGRTWKGIKFSAELQEMVAADREGLARLKGMSWIFEHHDPVTVEAEDDHKLHPTQSDAQRPAPEGIVRDSEPAPTSKMAENLVKEQ